MHSMQGNINKKGKFSAVVSEVSFFEGITLYIIYNILKIVIKVVFFVRNPGYYLNIFIKCIMV